MQDKHEDHLIAAFLRPLGILELEDERITRQPAQLDATRLLGYVTGTNSPSAAEEIIARYKEVSTAELDLIAVPHEQTIMEKMVWPLLSAKITYCLGQYLACVAMCGLVGEMWAILLFEIKGTPGAKAGTSMEEFEKLGQQARIKTLFDNNLIEDETKRSLKEIAGIRRKYLHFLSATHKQLRADASKTYKAAFAVVSRFVGMHLVPGSYAMHIDPDVFRFVKTEFGKRSPR